jgi:hypothetical protein
VVESVEYVGIGSTVGSPRMKEGYTYGCSQWESGSLKTRDRKASNHAIGTGKSNVWRRQGDCISTSSERPERRSRGRMRTGVSWRLKLAERGAQVADGCVDAASKQND